MEDHKNKYLYQNIFDTFDSSEHGLDNNEVEYRLRKYGRNQLEVKKETHWIAQFLSEYSDPMMLLLIFATIVALFSGHTTDAVIIIIVLLMNGIISFMQKYKAEKAIEALKKMVSPQARVLRHSQQIMIDTKEIVPGDIIIINEGDTIPADSIVFHANELQTSESMLTGESFPVSKQAFDIHEKGNLTVMENIVFMGTSVARGNGRALVIKTGMETEFGKIASLTHETKKDKTPLEKEIKKVGIFAAQATLLIISIIFIFELFVHQRPILENILFASSIAVAAVPEGLPAVITIALALGVQRLSKKNAIIRQLASVETLGATTVICTDKTGTLTKNEMTVTKALIDDLYVKFSGSGYSPTGDFTIITPKNETLELNNESLTSQFERSNHGICESLKYFALCAELCNNSKLELKNEKYRLLGDPTEGGLLSMARKLAFSGVRQEIAQMKEIYELPFDSERKMMSKIFLHQKSGKYYVFTKGAPETIISVCDQRIHGARTTILTRDIRAEITNHNEIFNEKALRTIGLAFKQISTHELNEILNIKDFESKQKQIEKKLIFLGIAGLSDPPREEVKKAVELTKIAGIKSYIVTGDHGFTTAAIAKKIGMISDQTPYEIISGAELDQIDDKSLAQKLKNKDKDIIFARTKPEHKLRIVSLLKQNQEIVAVTGDGVNDAPALKRADIGVAMGITGSDVSKEAASMVLMDDSFGTIITAIKEGRVIYANLKKFIFYIFASNIGELFTIFVALLIGLESPLTAILILTVNFVTDLFPALALGIEPPEKDIMKRKPRRADEKIMNKEFIQKIIITGSFNGMIMIIVYLLKLFTSGWSYGTPIPPELMIEASSLVFITMVFLQITISFNAKTERKSLFTTNIFNNKNLIYANISSILIAWTIIEIPFFQTFFRTQSLSVIDWGYALISCLIMTLILEILKYYERRKQNRITTATV